MPRRRPFSRIERTVTLAAMALISCLAPPADSQDRGRALTKDQAVLKINLRKFDFNASSRDARLPIFVDFTDSNHIAIAWQTYDHPAEAERTKFFDTVAMHLHVLVLDTITGKEALQEWPAPARGSRFLGQKDGKFITCIAGTWRLYSPSFELLRSVQTDNTKSCRLQPGASPGISPARSWVLNANCSSRAECPLRLLNSESLETKFADVQHRPVADLSDHWLVSVDSPSRQLFVRKFDEPWRRLQSPWLDEPRGASTERPGHAPPVPLFVGDENLLVRTGREMAVLDIDGTVLLAARMPENRRFGPAARASAHGRFAIVEQRMRGVTSDFWDLSAFPADDRVVVFDLARRQAIFAVQVEGNSPWPPFEEHTNRIALSQNGDLLAILSDDVLNVYPLPTDQQ
jgi:hypothetical protein